MLRAISSTLAAPMSNPTGLATRASSSGGGDFAPEKAFADEARLALAADHAQKQKRLVNPLGQHVGVVLMAPRDD